MRSFQARSLQRLICALAAAVAALATVSCAPSATTARVTVTPTPTATHLPTPTPTLPSLRADSGWTTALDLGYVSDGVTMSGGAFQATNVYFVVVTCEGAGKVVVDYEPDGTSTFACGSSPQTFTNLIGTAVHPQGHQSITVSVAADSGVVWRALIEVKQ